ncbi:MAG: carboxypeptidase regulatory-like domain-containing protein [Salinibacter sp.]
MRRWATIPILLLAALVFAPTVAHAQGVTSATIRGTVVDENDEPIPGANVVAVHEPSGSRYGTATSQSGDFTIANVRVGGPYTITVSFVGYQSQRETDIQLSLGETRELDFQLQPQTEQMDEVEIVGDRGAVFSEERQGISTNISEQEVESTPTIDRSIADFARLTPQAIVGNDDDDGASISIAGQNNRYNSIFIDGAISNDVFGLSATGTDGGQTGATPISIGAIKSFNIEISPFDVTQSYFGGGAINAVTRSGTNQFQGSFAFEYRDQSLAENLPSAPFPEFSNERYVGRLGGPIIKDKLFFFVNFDINNEVSPQPFEGGFQEYRGTGISSESDLNDLLGFIDQTVGNRYDPGSFRGQATTLDSDKFFGKLDWNINQNHRLSLRYNYSDSRNVDAFGGSPTGISFSSTNEVFPNTTQTGALELNSTFGNSYANKLILTYKDVTDDRDTNLNQPFPTVDIGDGAGNINLGGEPFSTVNFLDQQVFTLTNDFDIFAGDHTITVGTHNELYDLTNKFVPFNYGWYIFFDRPFGPERFQNGTGIDEFKQTVCASPAVNRGSVSECSQYPNQPAPSVFARGFSLVDDNPSTSQFEEVIGDETDAKGAFRALNTSLYVQDEWSVSDRLTVTGGIRVDVPVYLDDPAYANPERPLIPDNPQINPRNTTLPALSQYYDVSGIRPGETPDANLHWAPRFGFNLDAFGDQSTQIRGGTGVFTSRQPFVWPGGMYLNNGTNTGVVDFAFGRNSFRPNPQNGLTVADVSDRSPSDLIPSGRLEMFEEDYMNPRFWRTSFGIDQALPAGFTGTLEAQYSNTLKNVLVTNVNLRPANATLDGPDNRPIWVPSRYGTGQSEFTQAGDVRVDTRYSNIHRVGNTDRGYSYNLTARLRNTFEGVTTETSALSMDLSYTYGDAYVVNDGTSSQINSLWDGVEHVNGANNIGLSRSDFSTGHRVLGRFSYQQQILDNIAATVSLVYDGQSGRPFSYVIGGSDRMVQERGESNSLLYVPRSGDALSFRETTVQGLTLTPRQQAAALEEFISQNDYLSTRRGEYAERNADRTPWEGVVDLNFRLEIFQELLGRRQSVELTANVFNFSSLVGDLVGQEQWGERYFGTSQVSLTQFRSFKNPPGEGDGNPPGADLTPVYTAEGVANVVDTNGDGTADEFRGALDQQQIFNEIRTGSTYSSQWQMKFGVRYTF